ncbi:unnamed protein product [Dovyalis caffra]|uniref:protein-serine/threonine phosphatase n=1 Tax=Dovyalis caffra TaxID=77055 RepID=A0AAV1QP69_9ROSI|nr:unnamed protein product [Dovyalis caffra]
MPGTGKEILNKMKVKAGFFSSASSDTGKGKSKMSKHLTHGYHSVEGKSNHVMEDYIVSDFKHMNETELGLFAIFDGHLGHDVANYLQTHLFDNILKEHDFWTDTESAIRRAYRTTDAEILEKVLVLGKGGSTAVTAILINGEKLVVANVGDSRAVICKNGVAEQLSVDHEPSMEKGMIESRGGFVSYIPGDVPRVDGQLAVARAFGDKSLKIHLSSEPDVVKQTIHDHTEFLILASDGIWKVMSNQEAVDSIKHIKDAHSAAKHLIEVALSRKSKDDISCIVVRVKVVTVAMLSSGRKELRLPGSSWSIALYLGCLGQGVRLSDLSHEESSSMEISLIPHLHIQDFPMWEGQLIQKLESKVREAEPLTTHCHSVHDNQHLLVAKRLDMILENVETVLESQAEFCFRIERKQIESILKLQQALAISGYQRWARDGLHLSLDGLGTNRMGFRPVVTNEAKGSFMVPLETN